MFQDPLTLCLEVVNGEAPKQKKFGWANCKYPYETRPREMVIILVVFIKTNIQTKMTNTTTMIPCRRISKPRSQYLYPGIDCQTMENDDSTPISNPNALTVLLRNYLSWFKNVCSLSWVYTGLTSRTKSLSRYYFQVPRNEIVISNHYY